MKQFKVLNLYAGIGGNAKSFPKEWDVTAVEWDEDIAQIYKDHFPNHNVIVGNALDYLEKHYNEFDFIWASPPCPSHSRARKQLAWKTNKTTGERYLQNKPILPDMTLYSIIIFLQHYEYEGGYVIENVIPYYKPLIPAYRIGRHLFWSNIDLTDIVYRGKGSHDDSIKGMQEHKGFNLDKYKEINKRTLLRNTVDYRISDLIIERFKDETY